MLRVNFSFQLQWKQLKIVVELFCVCFAIYTETLQSSIIYHLFACTSHFENTEKRFPLCTKIVFSNIFTHPPM